MPEQVNNRVLRYRRPHGRGRLVLPLVLCACHQAPPVGAQDAQSEAFASQLARRLTDVHPDVLEALALERPAWRAERLLGLSSDLSDLLLRYEAGAVGESAVRSAALDVAGEAASVWAATCGLTLDAVDAHLDAGVGR